MQGLAELGLPEREQRRQSFFRGGLSSFCQSGCVSVGSMLGLNVVGAVTVVDAHSAWWRVLLLGVPPAGLGEGVDDCRGATVTPKVVLFGTLGKILGGKTVYFFGEDVFKGKLLLSTLATVGSPFLVIMMYTS